MYINRDSQIVCAIFRIGERERERVCDSERVREKTFQRFRFGKINIKVRNGITIFFFNVSFFSTFNFPLSPHLLCFIQKGSVLVTIVWTQCTLI